MIFITGCNGLVGSHIARQLLLGNPKIIAFRRKTSDMSLVKDIEKYITWVEGDIMDVELLKKTISNCDTVIHSAAIISFSPKRRNQMYTINVQGTTNVVNAALVNNVKRFCYVSSIAAIGRKKNNNVIDEKSLWEEHEYNTHYAKSKYLAELEVWRGIEEGLPAFIINPSVILGQGNLDNGSTKLFNYVFRKNKFYTNGYLNYVDVDDVASITVKLIEKECVGERFILNAGNVSYKDLFSKIATASNLYPPSIKVTKFFAELFWRLENIRSLFSSSEPIITKETVRLSNHCFKYSNAKITNFLNHQFTPLSETIAKTTSFFKNSNVNKKC